MVGEILDILMGLMSSHWDLLSWRTWNVDAWYKP